MRRAWVVGLALLVASTALAEDWSQFRRDERHSGWAAQTLSPPFQRIYDGTLQTYWSGWKPATNMQIDNLTLMGQTIMLMGSVAGGDPPQPHGSARWAAYLDRTTFKNKLSGGQGAYRPALYFLESISPKAGIETDSGHHPCQFTLNSANNTGGWMMESGFLKFSGGTVYSRSQSDIFGPSICRDDRSEGLFNSRTQWHGGGMYAIRQGMRHANLYQPLWAQWGPVANDATDDEILGYSIAYDAVYADQYLVSNFVTSAGNPQNLPKDWDWAPEVSGLCSWSLDPFARLNCRPGSWGQMATDGQLLWTYEQTPYDRIPNGYWQVGGASRKLVALSIPNLETWFEADVGDVPLQIQDAPLVGPATVVTVAYHGDQSYLEAYDRVTKAQKWSRPVPIVARSGGCPYWPARYTEQVTLAASGNNIIVASDGLTMLDADTGEQLWQANVGTTYFNPVLADGLLYVLRDDSGPGQDPVTGNCSGSALEVWGPPPAGTPTAVPTDTATAPPTATATRTATASRTSTPTRTSIAPTATRTPVVTATARATSTNSPVPTATAPGATATPTMVSFEHCSCACDWDCVATDCHGSCDCHCPKVP